MEAFQKKMSLRPIEKQILDHPWAVNAFLYALVPTCSGFNIYCLFTGRYFASANLTVQLLCFLVLLISIRNALPDLVKIRIFRSVIRCQFIILALYLIYGIGVLHQLDISPWSFLFIFLLFAWMPNREGRWIALAFVLVLCLLLWQDKAFLSEHSDYLIRFFSSLTLFSFLSFFAVIIRKEYLKNLFETRADLERSEGEYRRLSQRLQTEIAHRDRIEKKLHHAIKMETVGRVAAGVAHDLNNILSGIVTYPDLILLDMEKDDPLRGPLETMRESGIKAAAIVDDLLTLSRRGVPVSRTMDLRQITHAYLHSPEYGQLTANHGQVTTTARYDTASLIIKGSPVHLSKTLMNLVSNAAEAMPGGGQILIQVQAQTLDRPEPLQIPIQGISQIPKGRYVVLSVKDNGIGIAAREIESIFEPFYTKKVMGRSGTGLGMAVVLGTVNDHNGFIRVDSVVEKGTLIRIYFPASSEPLAEEGSEKNLRQFTGGHGKILVIDDVQDQLRIAEKLLTRLGYRVWCCASGEEGLALLKTQAMDLIVCDIIMAPGMDGIETCEQILKLYPNQKILFVTGFSDPGPLARAEKLGKVPCLFKPYTLEALASRVLDRLKDDGPAT